MEYISGTIFSLCFKVRMNTEFRRCGVWATAFNSGEQVLLPILYLLRTMKRFFCHVIFEFYHKTRIILAVVNILTNYRQWRQYLENSKLAICWRRAVALSLHVYMRVL